MNEFDIEDETTWPSDPEDLLQLIEENTDPETDTATEVKSEADEETVAETDAATEAESETKEGDVSEADDTVTETETDPELPILTKDGNKTIPFHVLSTTRESLKNARGEIQELKDKLASANVTPEPTPLPEGPDKDATFEEQVQAARENWGDVIADGMIKQNELEKANKELQDHISNIENRESQRELEVISNALATSPTMVAWEADEDQTWMSRATELSNLLVNSDAEYAAMDWNQRFAALPNRVKDLYSDAPIIEPPKPETAAEVNKSAIQADVAKKLEEAKNKESMPTSLTDIKTGGETEAPKNELDDISAMEPHELQAKMDSLAKNPEALEAFLAKFS